MPDKDLPPGPWGYSTTAFKGEHPGEGHVTIVDANNIPVAACFGPPDTKIATAALMIWARDKVDDDG